MSRIIAGQFGGRHIQVPASGTRPTTDRVRESIFNILQSRINFHHITVLDLYAGSGALGLESLSRGAQAATFVDISRQACSVIKTNISLLQAQNNTTVYQGKTDTILATKPPVPAQLIFLDPPYELANKQVEETITLLEQYEWIHTDCIIVVERSITSAPLQWTSRWIPWEPRCYGSTKIEIGRVEHLSSKL